MLQTEHIDNPKGYGEGEDARKYDPRLRGPVDPRELEIDMRTGMKNYIANGECLHSPISDVAFADAWRFVENGTWDTSKALVRRTIEKCVQLGRAAKASSSRAEEKANLYESYRLLGQAVCSYSRHGKSARCLTYAFSHRCTRWKTSQLTLTGVSLCWCQWDIRTSSYTLEMRSEYRLVMASKLLLW